MNPRLITAAQIGSIDDLYTLIHEDPYVLEAIDVVPFINTPLHVASAYGNLAFAMEMMNLKPSFARKLNTYGLSPLHLAIEKGQTRLTLGLLKLDPDLVCLRGNEGTTPFHMLVRRGEIDLMTEFLLACPGCVRDVNVNGETALHIAVLNDRYEELEVLVGWVQRLRHMDAKSLETQVLNRRDGNGNTALHIATYQKNIKAIKLLLGSPAVNRNIHNRIGLTALDILQNQRHNNNRTREIQETIRKSGGKSANSLPKSKKVSEILRSPISFKEHLFTHAARYRNQISDASRSALLVIAALIITTTYMIALQPPGGVYQSNAEEGSSTKSNKSVAGEEYIWAFIWIMVPLHVSYLVSMAVISPDKMWYLPISVGWVMIVVVVNMVVYFLRWKLSSKKEKPELIRSELILEGLTTLDQAKGV
ncbi:PREDICTED: serine/threonine-protein phosphatase 6 regulatory ankyrin repeat subunit B-like isoform X2 [Camelina sativa]|uniref:Serine/threonine-protein phosphatase 6 regulatory ankyrin repeat subunit B-like isoform X2 n=1 Tax=Camelina sativa TaxID=90675 RepID=A0ABM0TZN3_CAMSA|nr:PREDICTED: serine/threonine-protein phosphatase 6 regulatory ankyrin repeat subunit B-like isoform X2 [Camelina sativa]